MFGSGFHSSFIVMRPDSRYYKYLMGAPPPRALKKVMSLSWYTGPGQYGAKASTSLCTQVTQTGWDQGVHPSCSGAGRQANRITAFDVTLPRPCLTHLGLHSCTTHTKSTPWRSKGFFSSSHSSRAWYRHRAAAVQNCRQQDCTSF